MAADREARQESLEIAKQGLKDWFDRIGEEERTAGSDPVKKWWH